MQDTPMCMCMHMYMKVVKMENPRFLKREFTRFNALYDR